MVASTTTPNLRLTQVGADFKNWALIWNNNLAIIDATVGTYFVVQNLQGPWANSTAYTVGQSVVDVITAVIYQCQVAHTSSGTPATFAQDRAASPTFWTVYSSPARARGAWTPLTSYALNDFVVSGSQYCVCTQTHISGTVFATDRDAGKWSVLVDLSAAGSQVLPVPGGIADGNKAVVTTPTGSGYTIVATSTLLTMLGAQSVGTAVLQASSAAVALAAIGAQAAGSYQTQSANLNTLSAAALGVAGLSILACAAISDVKLTLGYGTAAALDVGTTALKVVQLDGAAKLPAVDGSQLTNLPSSPAYFTTGDIKMTWKTAADSGWIMHNDGSIGSATSGATTRANADTATLYALIWTNFAQADAPVAGGARGANAAADFAANKAITLPRAMGYAMGVAGAGAGITARTLGHGVGTETVAVPLKNHTHTLSGATIPLTDGSGIGVAGGTTGANLGNIGVAGATDVTGDGAAPTASIVQPTQWYNVMIKL